MARALSRQLAVCVHLAACALHAADTATIAVIDDDGSAGRVRGPACVQLVLPATLREAAREGRLVLIEQGAEGKGTPAQFDTTSDRIWWLMPPGQFGERRFALSAAGTSVTQVVAHHDRERQVVRVTQGDRPVLQYNHGATIPPEGIDKKYARGDYVHPLYGLDGEVLTDDYPRDHPHHRALNWSWATILWKEEMRDAFAVRGAWHRPVRLIRAESGPVAAVVEAESRWMWDDKTPIVQEHVVIRAFREANRARCVDFEIRLTALVEGLQFCGRKSRGYSGFNLRMVPADARQIRLHNDPPAAIMRRSWADYLAEFKGGKGRSGVAIIQYETNPAYPNNWIKYDALNFFQPSYPGGEPIPMPKDETTVLKYRVLIHAGALTDRQLSDVWTATNFPPRDSTKLSAQLAGGSYREILGYQFGSSRRPLIAIEDDIRRATSGQREQIEDRLIATLEAAEATDACKQFLCQMLQRVGSPQSVPALAKVLAHEKLAHWARYALERIPGEEADRALRQALSTATGAAKAGIINTIAERGDRGAVPDLAKLVADKDLAVAKTAIAALGRLAAIGALKRATVAEELVGAKADAYLLCADGLLAQGQSAEAAAIYQEIFGDQGLPKLRVTALRGMVRSQRAKAIPTLIELISGQDPYLRLAAVRLIRELPQGKAVTTGLSQRLPSLRPAAQVMLLNALSARGDSAAAPDIVSATQSNDEPVRSAALRALAVLGDASHAQLLAETATSADAIGRTAFAGLCRLRGDDVDDEVLRQMENGDVRLRGLLIRSLAARRCGKAVPALLASAKHADAQVRTEALRALAVLAGADTVQSLVGLLVQSGGEREAEKAVVSACKRAVDRDQCVRHVLAVLSEAEARPRCSLLRVLGQVGGDRALQAVVAETRSADAAVKDAAVRALAAWPDASAAPELLNLARTSSNLTHQVLALRGCIRVVGQAPVSPDEKTRLYREAIAAARRPEEKKLVLASLATQRTIESLGVAATCLDDDALRAEAALTVVKIACPRNANDKGLVGRETAVVLKKALGVVSDRKIRTRILEHLIRITPPDLNVALHRPTKSSVGHQGAQKPELAVDGRTNIGSAWWGGDTPSWLQVDLGKPLSINAAHVIFYWGGGRYYQYTIDVSLDGKEWATVVDNSKNEAVSTPKGFTHAFTAVSARYVRVHVIKNSLNPGAHIVELKVFAEG